MLFLRLPKPISSSVSTTMGPELRLCGLDDFRASLSRRSFDVVSGSVGFSSACTKVNTGALVCEVSLWMTRTRCCIKVESSRKKKFNKVQKLYPYR